MNITRLVCFLIVAYVTSASAVEITTETANVLYQQAVKEARSGRTGPALESLRTLQEELPGRQDILGDYAVVLGWAGQHEAALLLLEKIKRADAPAYVLEGLAGSARRLQRFELSESLYREANAHAPLRLEPQIGLALILADQGKLDEANAMVMKLRAQFPRRIDVLEASAEIATARRDYFGALAIDQKILAQEPDNRAALQSRILTLARIGAPGLAITLADRSPGVLDPQERDALEANDTASRIRWGSVAADTGRGLERFALIDSALEDSESAGKRSLDPAAELPLSERQRALDRIVALSERFRMQEAIDLFQAIVSRKAAVPPYAKSAAASAYLYLEQPERARDLYYEVLDADPDNLEARLGLFYALDECEQHDAALAHIERVVATTPSLIDAWSAATIRENPAYARVLAARAMAPLFFNRPGEAEHRLHALSDRAPFNMDIRTSYASSLGARGWPRTAEQELRWILSADPNNSGALGERAGALLEMRDYRAAEVALVNAQAVAAEDKRVMRATRLSEVNNMRELIVDGTLGRSSGGPTGTKDFALESWLYSSPIAYQYRAFAHAYGAQSQFSEGTARRERVGVGLEYRTPQMIATGELVQGINGSESGVAGSLAYTPNDFWTFRGGLDSSSNEIPLQARLTGVNARRAFGEVIWRAHESRRAAVLFDYFDFSDGNRREVIQALWTERVFAGPVYKLEVTAGLYTSHNSLAGTEYFNPSNDFSPTLEFANEWLQWRRYTQSFRHRLVLTVGSYSQQGFGSGPVSGARYEQEWQADDRLVVRYGVGRSLHPYEGVQTGRNYGYLYLNWRF